MDFSRIPTVLTSDEVVDKAFRRASKVEPAPGLRGADKARSIEQQKIGTIREVVHSTLERYERTFPRFDVLPPFYRELAAVALDVPRTQRALGALTWASDQVRKVTMESGRALKRASSTGEMRTTRNHAYGRVADILKQIGPDLRMLAKARKALQDLPHIDPGLGTLVVAGFPNVGKSSLVRRISTAKPAIAPYPFTTKGINIGHFDIRRRTYQVVDTPGLLDRPLEERNEIELQAILALRHLGDAVVYLLDPTGHCGYPLERQEQLLREVEVAFAGAPLVVVETKRDLGASDKGRPGLSAETGEGVEELLEKVVPALKLAADRKFDAAAKERASEAPRPRTRA